MHSTYRYLLCAVLAGVAASTLVIAPAAAQDKGKKIVVPPPQPQAVQQKQAPAAPAAPAPLACGMQGDAEILCGARSPEDLELTPDGKAIIVSQNVRLGAGRGAAAGDPVAPFVLFDLAKKTFIPVMLDVKPLTDWGAATCPGPIGTALAAHGISLAKRKDGKLQFFVVNHGGRESIEMYELKKISGDWNLIWHGCVPSQKDFNDVAALPDGGFVATHPTAIQAQGTDLFSGQPTGYVVSWTASKGELELPGTRFGYPNGVIVSSDGRYAYYNAWTAKEVHKYDLKAGKEAGVVKLAFMPDNLTWTRKGQILAAGILATRGDCPVGSGIPCIQSFGVAEIDPAKMTSTQIYDSQGKGALISGVSVALEAPDGIYIGAFQGDRLV
ncbi:MAG: SMP-30/gluconolactonase/LRE family protein, partial [Acidobacteriota bacterium]